MKFQFTKLDHLPRLSWCAILQYGEDTVQVFHGPWVETGESLFVEGAWDGDFGEYSFDTSEVFMGSGARIIDDGILFSTPCHTIDRLHIIQKGHIITVSNSLAFALEQSNTELDDSYPRYLVDFNSVIRGLKKYKKEIRIRPSGKLTLHYYKNILIDRTFTIAAYEKKKTTSFQTFESYYEFLKEKISAIYENAGSKKRKICYKPITTVSTGYDSVAATVLARKTIGCTDAITVCDARQSGLYKNEDMVNDSGHEIAQQLGMNCLEIGCRDYLMVKGFDEAEFYSTGIRAGEMVFAPLEKVLSQRMLFTGYHGDKIWDKNNPKATPYIERGDASGSPLAEYRLRVGFIHLPVPFLGCIAHPSIYAISNSQEMKPWSLNNDYDRPIPRRIAEINDIPREIFGQRKKAVGAPLWNGLKDCFREENLVDYAEYIEDDNSRADKIKLKIYVSAFNKLHFLYRIKNKLSRLTGSKILYSMPLINRLDKYNCSLGEDVFCVQWAIKRLKPRYRLEITSQSEH